MSSTPDLDSRTQDRATLAGTTCHVQGFGRYWLFATFTVVLIAVYVQPLHRLLRYSLGNQLYSHILIIPFVSAYLVWLKRDQHAAPTTRFSIYAAIPVVLGLCSILFYWVLKTQGWAPPAPDQLSLVTLSFVSFLIGGTAWIFGPARARALAFPLAFLAFIVPFPSAVTHAIEMFFQQASADAASLMFELSQTSVLRDGLFFKLPGITIEVAEECSGIRSTLVLFITSLVGAYLFFQSKTHRAVLALAIIPIAIVRNGFRIFTIAMLCVHVSPEMIHSWIHRRGGPLFFALSLLPFFAVLIYLYTRERRSELKRIAT
jgi:exosortase C (VPDSG-CTERM-specific)